MNRDYNVCPENADGKHGPITTGNDYDIDPGYVSVQCESCGASTGYPIGSFVDDLEWN